LSCAITHNVCKTHEKPEIGMEFKLFCTKTCFEPYK